MLHANAIVIILSMHHCLGGGAVRGHFNCTHTQPRTWIRLSYFPFPEILAFHI